MIAPYALIGFLQAVSPLWLLLGTLVLALGLGFVAAPLLAWTAFGGALVVGLLSWNWFFAYAAVMTVFNVPAIRRVLVFGSVLCLFIVF